MAIIRTVRNSVFSQVGVSVDLFEAKLSATKCGAECISERGLELSAPAVALLPGPQACPKFEPWKRKEEERRTKAGKPPDGIQYPLNRFTSRLLSDSSFSTSLARPVQLRLNNNNNHNRHQKNGNPGADPTLRH